MRYSLSITRGLLAGVALCAIEPWVLLAEERPRPPVREVFVGALSTQNSWISWAGGVSAFSGSLYDNGWRMRVLAAYGGYEFLSDHQPNTANPTLFEITPGYQFKTGPLISKFYFGLHGEQHRLDKPDIQHEAAGMGYGFKLLSENWIDLPNHSFVSLDVGFSTLNTSYQGLLRAGTAKFISQLSVGPEMQILGNGQYYQFRLGGFSRWKFSNGSIEGSVGYAQDYDEKSTPYFSLSWLRQF